MSDASGKVIIVTGGAGDDIFVITSGGVDTILDYGVGADVIDLEAILPTSFNPASPGSTITFSNVGTPTASLDVDGVAVVQLPNLIGGQSVDILYDSALAAVTVTA